MQDAITKKPIWKVYTFKNIYYEVLHRMKRVTARMSFMKRGDAVRTVRYNTDHADKVGTFYDAYHDKFLRVYGSVIQAFRTRDVNDLLRYQMHVMDLREGQRVLDAGCGVGVPALYFALHAGVQVDAITISKRQYDEALFNIQSAAMRDQVTITLGDYHQLPQYFVPGSYDVIYFLESFGHSTAKAHLLDICWTMLKPGGLLYIKDLFKKIPVLRAHRSVIAAQVRKINQAYRYDIADLNTVLDHLRRRGYILTALKTIDLDVKDFENLSISNEFQELTGIAKIDDWETYIFPVDFFEIKCIKPVYDVNHRPDRYFLQHLYHQQLVKRGDGEPMDQRSVI